MTRAAAAPWRSSRALGALLAIAAATTLVLLAPRSARLLLWGGALGVASLLAGVHVVTIERRMRTLRRAYGGALEIMSRIIDSVERYAENHSLRVAESAMDVARALGCSEAEVGDIRAAALLHDLGRLDLPAEALAEAAGLTPQELEEAGYFGRPGRTPGGTLSLVIPMVACCQERWDGTGRRALRGREIPLGARIIAVADAFDTIVTDRPYQKGRTEEEALATLHAAGGTQFDPLVVDVFLRLRNASPGEAVEARAA